MRELSDILADCRGAFSKLTESEKSANAETLAGKYAMSGFLSLMNAAPEDIGKLSGAIENCDGAAGKMADTMQNNLKGQLTVLKSQAEELAIGFGTELMPVAQDLVGLASSAVQGFSGLESGTKKFIVYAGLAAAATGPLATGIGNVTQGVGSVMKTADGAIKAFKKAIILNHIEVSAHCTASTNHVVQVKSEIFNAHHSIHVAQKNNTAPYKIYTNDIKWSFALSG